MIATAPERAWYAVENVEEVPSPGLLVYLDRVKRNLEAMVRIAGGPSRLRPHIKTHKLPEVVTLQLARGIRACKCATLAEAEMAARAGAGDVLLAYQPVGPNVPGLLALTRRYPGTAFAALVDDEGAARRVAAVFAAAGAELPLLLDLDTGMHRSGIAPGPDASALYALLARLEGVRPGGLHAYDGHLRQSDLSERTAASHAAFAPVAALKSELQSAGLPVPRIVAGGTPTFPIHARRPDVDLSPGTSVFWDAGYGGSLPDLPFEHAALVLTRVVSKPGPRRLCLDLGHKAVAAESPHPRVLLLGLEDAAAVGHSEEHLVVETDRAGAHAVGDVVYGIPWHICPTVALHAEVTVVENGHATQRWRVVARDRVIGD